MKVTIDTKEDSHEDIKKILHLLTNIIDRKDFDDPRRRSFAETTSSFDKSKTVDTSTMMQMFDEPEPREKSIPDTPPDFSSFLNLTTKREKRQDEPRIEFF